MFNDYVQFSWLCTRQFKGIEIMSYFPCDKCILLPICKPRLIKAYYSNKSLLELFKRLEEDESGRKVSERAAYVIYTGGMINLILGDRCELFRKYIDEEGLTSYLVMTVLENYKIKIPKVLDFEFNASRDKIVSCNLYQEIPK